MNKRGDTNTLWMVAGIIFVALVLAIGIYFLSGGTTKFSDFFSNLFAKENVDTVKTGCITACSTVSKGAWCDQQRTIRYYGQTDKKKLISSTITCDSWVNEKDVSGTIVSAIGTIENCPAISCT